MHNRVAVVTGGTSGIGKETALQLQRDGYVVYELSRRVSDAAPLRHITADITKEDTLRAAVDAIMAEEGRIDILVNNAGSGISGAIEFTDTETAQRQFDTAFFGMVRMNRLVLPVMRGQGGGRIVNVSSIAAPCPIPFQAYYAAAKAAVNSYTMSLANEVRPFGITVCAVQPGDIKTGFTAARHKSIDGDDVYEGRIGRSVARMEQDERSGMEPYDAGRYIAMLAQKKRVKPLYAIGVVYKLLYGVMKLLPCRLSNYILGRMYAS